ncbi:PhnD/SsuA/transferrin family substrate-binding protein [Kamptonema cortianum]|nr:PhnD/SsuA/transferrin family substrate-binding protein [Kamptonema cortianum]
MVTALRTHQRMIFVLFVCLALALTACRRGGGAGGPTLQPTLTPTPRSTPLPSLEPTLAPGSEDNPIRIVLARPASGTDRQINTAATALANAISQETSLSVTVEVVPTSADAITELCASVSGIPTAAWLNGLAYAAANAQGCGTAALIGRRGSGSDATTAETVQIIVNRSTGFTGLGGLLDPSVEFCRLSMTDLYSWLIPSLMMEANNVSPTAIGTVRDYEDAESLIQAVASGECDAAGVARSVYDEISTAAIRSAVTTLGTAVEVPYALLAYPLEIPLGTRLVINEALLDYSESALRTLLGVDRVIRLTDEALNSFNTFLRRTGLDFAAFGS